tara:strand:- start:532 stop:840 length:309 start_codon:yes stop_codon:yes gene_type:complete
MTALLFVLVPLVAGIAIGAGTMLVFINQRKVPLDQWTDRFKIDADDLAHGDNATPIGIVDDGFQTPSRFAEVTMFKHDQHERVAIAQHVVAALNCHRGELDL